MKRIALISTAIAMLTAGLARAETPPLLLVGGRVLDPTGTRWLDGRDVLIINDRIAAVGPVDTMTTPDGTHRVDVSGLSLVPGLIDLHTHLLLHPYDEASWNDQVLRESLELRTVRAVAAARATVEAGFTTIRDLGTEGAGFADVAIRDAVAEGIVPGPRVFVVTRALVATGCYGPSGFDPRWDVPKGAQVADGVDGVRRAVREQIAAGADWIKVYADYPRRAGDEPTPTFSQDELDAIVAEATSARLPVVAHATVDAAIVRAVNAGVKTIEHGYHAGADVLSLMHSRGVVLCPTLAANESMALYAGWTPGEPEPERIAGVKAMFKRALDAGVIIGCGSDAGVFDHGDNVRELELMVEYGMRADAALRSATLVAARVLGRENDLGQIAKGFAADLIAVKGDPLTDPSALRAPAVVVKAGALVIDRRAD